MIRDLVAEAHPDMLRALWPPGDVTWLVAGLTINPNARLLSVTRGPHGGASTSLLSVRYDVRDDDAARRAWRALKDTPRAGLPSSR